MSGSKGVEYSRLVIRDVMLVNGRGTPPYGPVDILIEDGKIAEIVNVDAISLNRYKPTRPEGDRVIDAKGMYVLPGLVDMHIHINIADEKCGPKGAEYAYKLCLAHGITTVRTCGFGTDEKLLEHKRLSAENKITAPNLVVLGSWPTEVHTVEEAREAVKKLKALGVDGLKIIPRPHVTPEILQVMAEGAREADLPAGVAIHIAQGGEIDALDVTYAGLDKISIEHTYGIPQAALPGTQSFPPDYNYSDEVDRFRYSGYIWQEADMYEDRVMDVLDTMIENGTVWDPTMVVYEGHRDHVRVQTLPWHSRYTVRQLWEAYSPQPGSHATHFFEWKTSDEVAWKEKYLIWMKYIKYFFDNGGTLTAGSDTAFIYALFGFAVIRELELFQEAGIHPIDVIQIATTNAHRCLGDEEKALGVRKGAPADLCVVDGNPLDNFKVMYGTGVPRYSADGKSMERGGGVRWTVKGGVVFDCKELLSDVEAYVDEHREA
ncbi:amidohydrolase family protein [Candidatus Bathyarchaeota archaeon]|nr:amidohydrolase family protein [Candidatus Bathyarchaeota archaeon]